MTEDEIRNFNALRRTLEACSVALNSGKYFSYDPGDNPLQLPTNKLGNVKSYDLGARVDYVLSVVPEAIESSPAAPVLAAPEPLRVFVDRIGKMTTPDLENMSNDETYEKARDLADLIAEAFELTKGAKTAPKPWFGWVASYGDDGLQVEFFSAREPFDKALAEAEREHEAGDLDTYTYGEEP